MISEILFTVIVLAVGVERLLELRVARRNAQWSFARGGIESGAGHYPVMVVLHTGLLFGALIEVWVRRPEAPLMLAIPMLLLAVFAQVLRWWCIRVLGPRWNTRVIIVPGLPLVQGGPYRWLNHPNYVAVIIEGAALPLIHGGWITALIFTLANIPLMVVRIRTENRALRTLPAGPEARPDGPAALSHGPAGPAGD